MTAEYVHVLDEIRAYEELEDWPANLSTLTRWADAVAALIAERDAYRSALAGMLSIYDNDDEKVDDARIKCARDLLAKEPTNDR